MNRPISGVKSTLYDGLNKQPNLLGIINPKCVLSYIYPAFGLKTTQFGLFLTKCFFRVCRVSVHFWQKAASYFFGLFYKKAKICFYCECTQIKANLLQFWLSSWLGRVVASTVRKGKNQVIAAATQLRKCRKSAYYNGFWRIIWQWRQSNGRSNS